VPGRLQPLRRRGGPARCRAAYSRYDVEADLLGAGPPQPPAFLDDFRFKRDYIKSELQELEQRKLAAPQYEIRMLTKDN
jgi:hypothetical protein